MQPDECLSGECTSETCPKFSQCYIDSDCAPGMICDDGQCSASTNFSYCENGIKDEQETDLDRRRMP